LGSSTLPDPINYYKFNEASGTQAQDSIGSNTGTIVGSPPWISGKFDKALNFDGSNRVTLATPFGQAGQQTATLWYKRDEGSASSSWRTLLGHVSSNYHHLISQSTTRNMGIWDGSFKDFGYNPPDDGEWHHYAVIYDSGVSADLYVDGNYISQVDTTLNLVTYPIGTIGNWVTSYYAGPVDEVKFYNSALTPEQVKLDMNAGSSLAYSVGNDEAADITDGAGDPPVAKWDFEENSGTSANDVSGNGNTGAFNNSPSWVLGKYGNGLDFNGSDEWLTITDSGTSSLDLTTAGTIEVWARSDREYPNDTDTSMYRGFVNKSSSGGTAGIVYTFHWHGTDTLSELRLCLGNGSSSNCPAVNIGGLDTSRWYHFAATWDASNIKWYMDGKLIETDSNSISVVSTDDQVNIGGRAFAGGNLNWDGKLDGVKIYDYARTQAQIAYDYNRGKPVAHWKFDECQGTTAYDSSGNGNNGTIVAGGSGTNTSIGTCSGSSGEMWADGATGKFGSSLDFDSTDDSVDITSNVFDVGLGDFSIAMWAKVAVADNNDRLFSVGGSYHYELWVLSGGQAQAMGGDSASSRTSATSNNSIEDNTWHHLVAVYDRDYAMKLYVDGVLQDDVETGFTAYSAVDYNETNGRIGRYIGGGDYAPEAQIDDVRFYNYALSDNQAKTLMNEGSSVRFGD